MIDLENGNEELDKSLRNILHCESGLFSKEKYSEMLAILNDPKSSFTDVMTIFFFIHPQATIKEKILSVLPYRLRQKTGVFLQLIGIPLSFLSPLSKEYDDRKLSLFYSICPSFSYQAWRRYFIFVSYLKTPKHPSLFNRIRANFIFIFLFIFAMVAFYAVVGLILWLFRLI